MESRVIPLIKADLFSGETAKIRDAIVGSRLPDGMAEEIVRAYGKLGDEPYVAVRSSGTAEDLADASFAGQYDTYLDVRGGKALSDAVRQCLASMWTARVTAYRQNKGFDHRDARIAVVVQTMVEPDVDGVMFIGNYMAIYTIIKDTAVILRISHRRESYR